MSLFIPMKARKRFFLLFFVAILTTILIAIYLSFNRKKEQKLRENQDFYHLKHFSRVESKERPKKENSCRMNTCFDLSRCLDISQTGLRVHLYPSATTSSSGSASFGKIEEIIRNSNYFERNAKKACLFMATIWDPLDRDSLSPSFQRATPAMTSLEALFSGVNHVVFNLYSGSWPEYSELDFSYNQNYGQIEEILKKAILIKASQSRDSYRRDFDVSLPLFSRKHPIRGTPFIGHESQSPIGSGGGSTRRRLLVFKGKRYIYGIGSETRNSLHYLHNNDDVIIVTTCKHGKKWKQWKDDKCERDNSQYDKHDYQQLMSNSTFCLVPRGRRLGSYRFLEALQLGCIPVVLSNGWVLPFEEIIDWKSCVVSADERLLLQIPETLRSFSSIKISKMRHKCLLLYELYFSSVERIVFTSLLIIEQRIQSHVSLHLFATTLPHSPSLVTLWQLSLNPRFGHNSSQITALIHIQSSQEVSETEKLIPRVLQMSIISEILILSSLPITSLLIPPQRVKIVSSENRFGVHSESLNTDAVVQLSPQSLLSEEEIEFAFSVWKSFPSRVIGFVAKSHDWRQNRWQYSSKWTNSYSLVEMDSSVYHKNFHDLFLAFNNTSNCSDLLFQFLVSHVTREGPLKVTQRKRSTNCRENYSLFAETKECFSRLTQMMSYLPLIESKTRLDPLLFKDNVSVKRKKFRKIEIQ